MSSLQVDDVTLLLALGIALVLSASLFLTRLYTPALHPLILTRQSDVSQIRQERTSPTFRNANSPSGFELAGRPRRGAADVGSMLTLGSATPEALEDARMIFGQQSNTKQVLRQATQFAHGLAVRLKGAEPRLALCVEKDSLEGVIALLASSQQVKPFTTFVVSAASSRQLPNALPSNSKANVIFTTLVALPKALLLPRTADTLLILPNLAEAQEAASQAKLTALSLDQVMLDATCSFAVAPLEASQFDVASARTFAHFWQAATQEWITITHGSLAAGVTAQLSFFPADAIPAPGDSVYIENSAEQGLGLATATPAGLALTLVALYTGASITSGPLLLEGNKASEQLKAERPTLLYTSTEGGAALATALLKAAGGGPLTKAAQRIKLGLLRHGAIHALSIVEALLAPGASKMGLSRARAILLVGQGNATQSVLDTLRVNVGACVMHAFLPLALPRLALTAPIMASHSLDLQAFAEYQVKQRFVPAHVGPACVAVEIRLFESEAAKNEGYAGAATQLGREGDWTGEIQVRGKTLGGVDEDEWRSIGTLATIRSNGTFVILRDSLNSSLTRLSSVNSKSRTTGASLPVLGLVALSLLAAPASAQLAGEHPLMQLSRRAGGLNASHVAVARQSMLVSQRASWEQGTAQSALLELDAGEWSVFTAKDGGPPWAPSRRVRGGSASGAPLPVLSMAYHSVSAQDARGKLCSRVTGDETPSAGSALDPAACLEGVLIGAYAAGQVVDSEVTEGYWGTAARAQLRYVLDDAPRTPEGAISHRASSIALWSDAVYMGPPALAAYGLITSNQSLLQAAYDQIRLYRDGLRIIEGPAQGMWAHINDISRPNASDTGAWLTGQGWVTAGMARVVASIAQSGFDMSAQVSDLVSWASEIQEASYAFAQPNGLLYNYVNVSSGRNAFPDAAGSALLASATYRFASMTRDARFVNNAERIYATTQGGLDRLGTFDGSFETVDALGFTFAGDTSPESLAAQLLLSAAKRDYSAGNVTGLTGPGSGFRGGAASNITRPSVAAALLVALVALATATLV